MPSTINGIGTHYHGKKNKSTRQGVCQGCGRTGVLTSYDTRLWFVVIFIPVFPLGRKRIIDECASCSRHFVASADEFVTSMQLAVSGAVEEYRSAPTPTSALQAHATMLGFHQHEPAADFRKVALSEFPSSAELAAGLAGQLEQTGEESEAGDLYEKAHRLEPSLPEARIGVGERRRASGELDQARSLLSFLEVSGAGQQYSLAPIDRLSFAFQAAGRHEEALEVAACLLREFPDAGKTHEFRKFVSKSEKALGRSESMLPPLAHSVGGLLRGGEGSPYSKTFRNLVRVTIVLAFIFSGLVGYNEFVRRRRPIFLDNHLGISVQIQVDDDAPRPLLGRETLFVSEGMHVVRITGAFEDTMNIVVESDYFSRFFRSPLWLVNVGGAGVYLDSTVYYSKQPRQPIVRPLIGVKFIHLPHVDYTFVEPPATMSVKGSQTVEKQAFSQHSLNPDELVQMLMEKSPSAAAAVLEDRLKTTPDSENLIQQYAEFSRNADIERAIQFFEAGLSRQPIIVSWHRQFQDLSREVRPVETVLKVYDGLLLKNPADSSVLYLRGRIEPNLDRAEEFFQKSVRANPPSYWASYAIAYGRVSNRQWKEALQWLGRAEEAKAPLALLTPALHETLLANGQAKSLLKAYREQAAMSKENLSLVLSLWIDAAVFAEGKAAGQRVLAEASKTFSEDLKGMPGNIIRSIAAYIADDFDRCMEEANQLPPRYRDSLLIHGMIAGGKAEPLVNDANLVTQLRAPNDKVMVYLALLLERSPRAAEWRKKATESLRRRGGRDAKVADLLDAKEAPTVAAVDETSGAPTDKAVLFAVLAQHFPSKAEEYKRVCEDQTRSRRPPMGVVRRAMSAVKKP